MRASHDPASRRSALGRLLREPLFHFLALGAALFVVWDLLPGPGGGGSRAIAITPSQVEHLVAGWTRTWQRPPTRAELDGLIEEQVREEVFYREAIAMGLDQDDPIIRRRLRQKLEFLSEDLLAAEDPSEAQLEEFLRSHPGKFQSEARVAFTQLFVNRDRRGEAGAAAEVKRLLDSLGRGADAPGADEAGDPLPLPGEFESAALREVASLFGERFAEGLSRAPIGRWAGPVESGYGLHVVLVKERTEARAPALAEVREAVEREWRAERQRQAGEELYRRLREKYAVRIELPPWVGAGGPQARPEPPEEIPAPPAAPAAGDAVP